MNPENAKVRGQRLFIAAARQLFTMLGTALILYALITVFPIGATANLQPESPVASSLTIVPYTGTLTDQNGNPITGSRTIRFSLWNLPTGGTMLWPTSGTSESHTVNVQDGQFHVNLGSTSGNGIPATIGGQDLWLQIQVGNEILQPRQQLGVTLNSINALTVPNRAITADKLAVDALPSEATHVQPTETIAVGSVYQVFPSTNTEITVTQRSNILITGKGNAVTAGIGGYFAGLCRDGVGVAPTHNYTPDVMLAPPYEKFTWTWIDTVEPGTYTYAICVGNSSNPTSVSVSWYRAVINLVAFPAP